MKFNYSKEEDALGVRFSNAKYAESDEVVEGFILDYDSQGRIIGFEILNASKRLPAQFARDIKNNKLSLGLITGSK